MQAVGGTPEQAAVAAAKAVASVAAAAEKEEAAARKAAKANRFACLLQPPFSAIGLPGSLFSLTLLPASGPLNGFFGLNPRFFDKGAFSHSRRSALVQNRPRRLGSIVR